MEFLKKILFVGLATAVLASQSELDAAKPVEQPVEITKNMRVQALRSLVNRIRNAHIKYCVTHFSLNNYNSLKPVVQYLEDHNLVENNDAFATLKNKIYNASAVGESFEMAFNAMYVLPCDGVSQGFFEDQRAVMVRNETIISQASTRWNQDFNSVREEVIALIFGADLSYAQVAMLNNIYRAPRPHDDECVVS